MIQSTFEEQASQYGGATSPVFIGHMSQNCALCHVRPFYPGAPVKKFRQPPEAQLFERLFSYMKQMKSIHGHSVKCLQEGALRLPHFIKHCTDLGW